VIDEEEEKSPVKAPVTKGSRRTTVKMQLDEQAAGEKEDQI